MMHANRLPAAFTRRTSTPDVLMDLIVGLTTGGMWLPAAPCADCRKTTQTFKRTGPHHFVCLNCAPKSKANHG